MNKIYRCIPLIISVVFIFYGLFFVKNLPLSGPPDELAHVSYIVDATNSNVYLPDYKNGKIIGGSELNFLSHPPLYYSVQALWGGLFNLNPEVDFKGYRILSLLMVSLGLFFILRAAKSLGLSDGFLVLLGLSVVTVPNFTYIASSINNDNLVFLGSSLLFWSIVTVSSAGQSSKIFPVVGVYFSLMMVALTKVNAALFAISFCLGWLVFTKGRFISEFFKSRRWFWLIFALTPVLLYYSYVYYEYNSFFPSPRYVYQLNSQFDPMSFWEYCIHFSILLLTRFTGAYGHLSYLVYPDFFVNGLFFLLVSPLVLYPGVRIFFEEKFRQFPAYRAFDAIYFGMAVLAVVHVYLGYKGYLATGIVAAVQPRYYLFLIPMIWIPFFVMARHFKFIEIFRLLFVGTILTLAPVAVSYSSVGLVRAKMEHVDSIFTNRMDSRYGGYSSTLPLMKAGMGNIDLIRKRDGNILMVGWSYHKKLNQTPLAIVVFHKNIQIARFGLNVVRPDVARQFKSIVANDSGFRFSLPSSIDAEVCEYDVLAEFENGIYSVLLDGGC